MKVRMSSEIIKRLGTRCETIKNNPRLNTVDLFFNEDGAHEIFVRMYYCIGETYFYFFNCKEMYEMDKNFGEFIMEVFNAGKLAREDQLKRALGINC